MTFVLPVPRAFFVSKVDAWISGIAVAAGFTCLSIAAPMVLFSTSSAERAVLAGVVLVTLVLPIWLLLDTNYTVTGEELRIRSGPFRWSIALSEVRAVSPSRSWLSSPALSLDRIRVQYGVARSVLVSPREKQRFVDCLRERCPAAHITGF
ncbi:MAG: PH domain-containing protein [Acidovorax sp.]|uniref:PH domain-containing protein n=1 Tax=unclassified Acidovorax TaxID=2684926 RepID=UPI0022C7B757|nr:PH domain-containing protein [Acidovorax sp.]MCZ8221010.1 PH domain-containing protein [Acidovorax sp.]